MAGRTGVCPSRLHVEIEREESAAERAPARVGGGLNLGEQCFNFSQDWPPIRLGPALQARRGCPAFRLSSKDIGGGLRCRSPGCDILVQVFSWQFSER